MTWIERAPEEYPTSLGLDQPHFIRRQFDPTEIIVQADNAYRRLGHIQMLVFWGVGWREQASTIDRVGLAHLAALVAKCQEVFLRGVRLTLLLGDNHAAANEIPSTVIQGYAAGIEALAQEFGFASRRLGSLTTSVAGRSPEILTAREQESFELLRPSLEHSARNLSPRDFERRARNYFVVRYREASAIAAAFPHAILANPDMPARAILAPPLPMFWINLLPGKRWRRLKPWFAENPVQSAPSI